MAKTKAAIARQMANRILYNKARKAAAERIRRAEKAGFIGAVLPDIPDHPPTKRDIDKLQRLTRKEIERRAAQAIDLDSMELVSKKELRKRNKAKAEKQRQETREKNKRIQELLKQKARMPKVSDAVLRWLEDTIDQNLIDSPRRAKSLKALLTKAIKTVGRDFVAESFESQDQSVKEAVAFVFRYKESENKERDKYFLKKFNKVMRDFMPPELQQELNDTEFQDFYGIPEEGE